MNLLCSLCCIYRIYQLVFQQKIINWQINWQITHLCFVYGHTFHFTVCRDKRASRVCCQLVGRYALSCCPNSHFAHAQRIRLMVLKLVIKTRQTRIGAKKTATSFSKTNESISRQSLNLFGFF